MSLKSTGCADASGFESCQSTANKKTTTCINQAHRDDSQKAILACGCQDYVNNYNCYAAFCWNKVSECDYQEYIVSYLQNCPIAKLPIPYFPAPNGAPSSCSIVEICPDTDPKFAGLAEISQLESQLNVQFDTCGKYMDTYDCRSKLSFSLDGVSTFYKPDDSIKSGTATLSNRPGTVTAPASGQTFTYTNGGDGVVYTIKAGGDKAGSGTKGDPSGSQSTTVPTESSSEIKGQATESSSKNAGATLETGNCLVLGAILVPVLAIW
ncbi:hypothetical protein CEP54_012602 [Fusarium duplospermum]|uniref:Uncharacterized protein n=1 Tax=Fusarium duplospermum TaxID=1325734 RepID=A0A428P7R9_9HYPO|nr:hypothetical protein CEP54_012602 [Fusarium duplospermum]